MAHAALRQIVRLILEEDERRNRKRRSVKSPKDRDPPVYVDRHSKKELLLKEPDYTRPKSVREASSAGAAMGPVEVDGPYESAGPAPGKTKTRRADTSGSCEGHPCDEDDLSLREDDESSGAGAVAGYTGPLTAPSAASLSSQISAAQGAFGGRRKKRRNKKKS